ncbi:MAG: lactate racemase domain-containing protein [Deltaproteobacteria bacterium]|nr:lactate racemase domain-containing protein [Deltaproteobacteria bacterium]
MGLKKVHIGKIIKQIRPSVSEFFNRMQRPGKVTVCVTDNTRPFPEKEILPHLLDSLEAEGLSKSQITILVATGLHRHLTKEELTKKFGRDITESYRIIQNDPDDVVSQGRIFGINRVLAGSDALFGTGVFEPHQYAGFSGGNKIFIIGCGGRETIDYTHSPEMILRKGVRLGNIRNNPFRKFIEKSAGMLPPRWIVNIVLNEKSEIVKYSMGEPEKVFYSLSDYYFRNLTYKFTERYDAVFVSISETKGTNLYQASRGATYMALSESPVIKRGAPVIVSASLEEGFGSGEGEREFLRILSSKLKNGELLRRLRSERISGGGQRAVMLLKTLLCHPVIFTGYKKKISFTRENLYFIESSSLAIDMVISSFRAKKILFIRNPFAGLFRFSEGSKSDI